MECMRLYFFYCPKLCLKLVFHSCVCTKIHFKTICHREWAFSFFIILTKAHPYRLSFDSQKAKHYLIFFNFSLVYVTVKWCHWILLHKFCWRCQSPGTDHPDCPRTATLVWMVQHQWMRPTAKLANLNLSPSQTVPVSAYISVSVRSRDFTVQRTNYLVQLNCYIFRLDYAPFIMTDNI